MIDYVQSLPHHRLSLLMVTSSAYLLRQLTTRVRFDASEGRYVVGGYTGSNLLDSDITAGNSWAVFRATLSEESLQADSFLTICDELVGVLYVFLLDYRDENEILQQSLSLIGNPDDLVSSVKSALSRYVAWIEKNRPPEWDRYKFINHRQVANLAKGWSKP